MRAKLQVNYYAFGLKIAALSSRRADVGNEGSLKNNYLYQGTYSELDEDIGWHDFPLRSYDAQLGRFMQADPFDQFPSPYTGMGNDPINLIDPSGGIAGFFGFLGDIPKLLGQLIGGEKSANDDGDAGSGEVSEDNDLVIGIVVGIIGAAVGGRNATTLAIKGSMALTKITGQELNTRQVKQQLQGQRGGGGILNMCCLTASLVGTLFNENLEYDDWIRYTDENGQDHVVWVDYVKDKGTAKTLAEYNKDKMFNVEYIGREGVVKLGYLDYGDKARSYILHANGNATPAGSGGGNKWLHTTSDIFSAAGIGGTVKTEMINYVVRSNYKSAQTRAEFSKLRRTQKDWRITNTLGKTGASYLKLSKMLGVAGNIIGVVSAGVQLVENPTAGNATRLAVQGAAIGVAALFPGVGWGIALGIGAADLIWGDDFYNWIDRR